MRDPLAMSWGWAGPVDGMEYLAETQDQSVTSEGWYDAKLLLSFKQAKKVSRLRLYHSQLSVDGAGRASSTFQRGTEVFSLLILSQRPPCLRTLRLSFHYKDIVVPVPHPLFSLCPQEKVHFQPFHLTLYMKADFHRLYQLGSLLSGFWVPFTNGRPAYGWKERLG